MRLYKKKEYRTQTKGKKERRDNGTQQCPGFDGTQQSLQKVTRSFSIKVYFSHNYVLTPRSPAAKGRLFIPLNFQTLLFKDVMDKDEIEMNRRC